LRQTPLLKGEGKGTILLPFKVLIVYCSAGAFDFLALGVLHFLTN